MAKVLFTVSYEIDPAKFNDFMFIVKELKSIISAEGLEDYSVYQLKGKKNMYQEVYTFSSEEAFNEYDDESNERVSILMGKLSDILVNQSSKYSTLKQLDIE